MSDKHEKSGLKKALAEKVRELQLTKRAQLAAAMDEGQGIVIPDDGVYVKKGDKWSRSSRRCSTASRCRRPLPATPSPHRSTSRLPSRT
jgi:hypothetical protein